MDIYIKPMKKASLSEQKTITIKDVAEVVATKDVADDVNAIKLLDIHTTRKENYLISVTDVIKAIKKKYPEHTVNNVGEMDTLIDYSPMKSMDSKAYKWLKIFFVSVILFVGSAMAIMSFYSDAQMTKIFENMHKIIFGFKSDRPFIIEIPYAIGLCVGIIMFFNHFIGKKVTDDPTPIEVQISLYEAQISDTIIDFLDVKKSKTGKENENDNR